MEANLVSRSHSVGRAVWHVEWCTKYRYKMMRKLENRNLVKACIRQAASRHGIKLLALEVMPEHVHAVIEIPHTMPLPKAVQYLKGYSSWKIFKVKEKFRLRYPRGHFWSPSYMVRTVGLDEQKAIEYVEGQQEHHLVEFI